VRVVVVSGHYPPNFVSGGSLQPQRLARGLRDRGHDVHVYAGRLDDDRRPLETWDEHDETGLPVRWIVTTPWDDWGSDRNWRAPEVHSDFVAFLGRVRPDVVHLHDLQMLGGSLVRAAKDAGARVVVTMHDFWWVCARLFLVDRHMRPCSLVVDAGTCRCQVNRRWLEGRDAALADELRHADLVLAPSATAARVLAANGVAPGRLRVDENGLPEADEPAPARVEHPRTGDVHFVYAGGRHALKGVTVLLAAAKTLGDLAGWRLTAHATSPDEPTPVDTELDALPVALEPPFAPDERDAVYGAADVVVVPSIMRETHSILTREALRRGVPVICTNTLGPEEVVVHGDNGLVVPAGDRDALADAMRSVVEHPELLARLRAGARRPVAIRSLRDQLDSLEATFRELVDEAASAPSPASRRYAAAGRPPISRVLFACGIEGAPLRYRARLPAEAIARHGVHSDVVHYRDPALLELVERADVLYVYRVPATVQFLDVVERAHRRGIPVIFDVDDLIFDPDIAAEIPALQLLPPQEAEGWLYGVRRYRTTMEHCDGYVGSTPMLVRHAREVTGLPAAQFDNGVGVELARVSARARRRAKRPGRVRLAYFSGTITHDRDWFFVEPAVVQVLEDRGDVELWLGGHLPDSPAMEKFAGRVRRLPFVHWSRLPSLLRDVDVNLAPLEPGSRFNEAKSAIKWLEAALVATPTIASPTEPFRDAVEHGVTGMLADDVDEWVDAVERLVDDRLLRRLVGERAEREALLRWSPHLQGQRFLDILAAAHDWRGATRDPAPQWTHAIADEPFTPLLLEPYRASRGAPLRKTVAQGRYGASWAADRLRESIREQGLPSTARRSAAFLRRDSRHRASVWRVRAGRSRPVEVVRYTRRLLAEEGAAQTGRRATAFALRRTSAGARTIVRRGPVGRARGAVVRLVRSIGTHGTTGTFELAARLVRHHVLHTITRLRAAYGRLRARLTDR
jgi:glycosyltransferase involved in cell wall biosynthesis